MKSETVFVLGKGGRVDKETKEIAQALNEKFQALDSVLEALGYQDLPPDNPLVQYLTRISTKNLKHLRAKILSRRKVVYLQQYQSTKST